MSLTFLAPSVNSANKEERNVTKEQEVQELSMNDTVAH